MTHLRWGVPAGQGQVALVEQGTGQETAGEFRFPQRAVIEDDRADGANLVEHRVIQLAAGEFDGPDVHGGHADVLGPDCADLAVEQPDALDVQGTHTGRTKLEAGNRAAVGAE